MKRPHWDLATVKRMVAAKQFLVQTTRALRFFPSRADADAAVMQTVALLTERDFAETVTLTWDVCDVYGVVISGAGWYLKLAIDHSIPEVAIVSFHPLERPLKTNKGVVKP